MNRALTLLASVFADPSGGAARLEELRSRWREFTPEERAALTPLAKLAAERVAAVPADDADGYWASLDAGGAPDLGESEWDTGSGGDAPAAASLRPAAPSPAAASPRAAAASAGDAPAAREAAGRGPLPQSYSRREPASEETPSWAKPAAAPAQLGFDSPEQLALGSASPAASRPARPRRPPPRPAHRRRPRARARSAPRPPTPRPSRSSPCWAWPPSGPASARRSSRRSRVATRSWSCRPAAARASATSCPRWRPTT